MSHYYQFEGDLESKKRTLKLYINDNLLSFVSDVGVFSNTEIDYGSFVFIKAILQEEKTEDLLDVGCGYGVIGITLKYFNHCVNLDMFDINERAVELTKENIERFKLENTNCFVSDGFINVSKNYDRIVINPPIRAGKKVIYQMFEDSAKHLKEDGCLYIVIKKSLGAPSAISKLQTLFSKVEVIKKDSGYYIIKSYNM